LNICSNRGEQTSQPFTPPSTSLRKSANCQPLDKMPIDRVLVLASICYFASRCGGHHQLRCGGSSSGSCPSDFPLQLCFHIATFFVHPTCYPMCTCFHIATFFVHPTCYPTCRRGGHHQLRCSGSSGSSGRLLPGASHSNGPHG